MMRRSVYVRKVKAEDNSHGPPTEQNERTSLRKLKSHFKSYCNHTGIHGFQYFGQNRTTIEKCWWAVVFIIILSSCGFAIYLIYNKWSQSPVIVSLTTKSTAIYRIPFPAVTICPTIKYKKDCFNVTAPSEGREYDLSEERRDILHFTSSICDWGENRKNLKEERGAKRYFSDEIYKTLLDCSPYLQSEMSEESDLYFMGKKMNFKKNFRPVISEDGLCFSFNMLSMKDVINDGVYLHHDFTFSGPKSQWIPQHGYEKDADVSTYPRRALVSGALTLVLPHRISDINYLNSGTEQGYKVILHFPTRVPRSILEHTLAPFGKATEMAVSADKLVTSDIVKSYSPENRGCYFVGEKKLQFFKVYTMNNCAFECLTNFTLKECECVPFYMPRNSSTPICGIPDMRCICLARRNYLQTKLRSKLKGKCYCLRTCNDITYTGSATILDFDWNKMSWDYKDLDSTVYDVTLVSIYFSLNSIFTTEMNELYGPTDFLSNFGGLLALFTGFSVLSFMEIIYFCTLRILGNRKLFGRWYD